MNQSQEEPTAIEYVEWLLKHMLRTNRLELTLNTQRALPGSDAGKTAGGPPCLPDIDKVINRLKILSELSPIRYPHPVEGGFERAGTTYTLIVSIRVTDRGSDSTCFIRIGARGKKA